MDIFQALSQLFDWLCDCLFDFRRIGSRLQGDYRHYRECEMRIDGTRDLLERGKAKRTKQYKQHQRQLPLADCGLRYVH